MCLPPPTLICMLLISCKGLLPAASASFNLLQHLNISCKILLLLACASFNLLLARLITQRKMPLQKKILSFIISQSPGFSCKSCSTVRACYRQLALGSISYAPGQTLVAQDSLFSVCLFVCLFVSNCLYLFVLVVRAR